jgi:hypothetical protein
MQIRVVASSGVGAVLAVTLGAVMVSAQDLEGAFKEVREHVAHKKYSRALESLGAARRQIEVLHVEALKVFLPDVVSGYTGAPVKVTTALGVVSLMRSYTRGAVTVGVAIRVGTTGGGQGSFGTITQLGRTMAAMRQGGGEKSVDVAGIPGLVGESRGKTTLTVFLASGGVVILDGAEVSEMKALAAGLNLTGLDAYLAVK